MASSWGGSWASSWADSWGVIAAATTTAGVMPLGAVAMPLRKKRKRIEIVEPDEPDLVPEPIAVLVPAPLDPAPYDLYRAKELADMLGGIGAAKSEIGITRQRILKAIEDRNEEEAIELLLLH